MRDGPDGSDDDGLPDPVDEPVVRLVRWTGPWPDDDPDANLKADVATYAHADPLATLTRLARNVDVPVGALVRYVLARWASGGSEALLELGPSTVDRMAEVVERAEAADTDAARLEAYDVLRQMVSWLETGQRDPAGTYPTGGAGARRWTRVAAYGIIADDERILLCRVAPGYGGAGRWTLPGGGLDHGEQPAEAAVREIREETGLAATLREIAHVDTRRLLPDRPEASDDLAWIRILYRAEVDPRATPRLLDVDGSTDDVRWVHRDELAQLPLVGLARIGVELAGLAPDAIT